MLCSCTTLWHLKLQVSSFRVSLAVFSDRICADSVQKSFSSDMGCCQLLKFRKSVVHCSPVNRTLTE